MTDLKKIEYRVKEKKVFFITRYCEVGNGSSVSEEGSFDCPLKAHRSAVALAKLEALSWGIKEDDDRLFYPTYEYKSSEPFSDKEK